MSDRREKHGWTRATAPPISAAEAEDTDGGGFWTLPGYVIVAISGPIPALDDSRLTPDRESAMEYPDLWLERAKRAEAALAALAGDEAIEAAAKVMFATMASPGHSWETIRDPGRDLWRHNARAVLDAALASTSERDGER